MSEQEAKLSLGSRPTVLPHSRLEYQ